MRERVKQVMKEVFGLNDIPDDISQKNCDRWDSMRHLQLAIGLETEFDISLEPEDIAEMKSLDDVEKAITSLTA